MEKARTLVTGALGNLGRSTVDALLSEGHVVRAFDLPTSANRRAARRLARAHGERFEAVFGDVTSKEDVARAVEGVDAIVHLAAMLPPATERFPERAYSVNVGGTERLLEAVASRSPRVRFVLASSISVYGPSAKDRGLAGERSPVEATDVYTETKIKSEELVRAAAVDGVILRVGAAVEGASGGRDPLIFRLMFEVHPENPMELVHGADVATAMARAVSSDQAVGRTLPIGGGPSCQIRQRELLGIMAKVMGIGELPANAFGDAPYYTCWLDTEESQRILGFQRHTLEDIERDLASRTKYLRPLLFLARPFLRRAFLSLSGPYRSAPPLPTFRAMIDAEKSR